jgi:hypothetical protein
VLTRGVKSFSYDGDGKPTQDGTYNYTWDGENRLIGVQAKNPSSVDDKKLALVCDYMGRRVEKHNFVFSE